MRHLIVFLASLLCIASAHGAPPATLPADAPAVQSLLKLAENLSSEDKQIQSLAVCAHVIVPDIGRLDYLGFYRAPDHFAVYMLDGSDQTPLLAGADGRAAVYDAVAQRLIYYSDADPSLRIRVEGDTLDCAAFLAWHDAPARNPKPPSVSVNLHSLLTNAGRGYEVEELGEGGVVLTAISSKGNRMVATLDRHLTQPIQRMAMITRGKSLPEFEIDVIRKNEPIEPSVFQFPSKEQLAAVLPLSDARTGGLAAGQVMIALSRSFYARYGVRFPAFQAKLQQLGLDRADWKRISRDDAMVAGKLRGLISIPAVAATTAPATTRASHDRLK